LPDWKEVIYYTRFTPERQSLEESTARGGGLPVVSYTQALLIVAKVIAG